MENYGFRYVFGTKNLYWQRLGRKEKKTQNDD